MKAFESRPGVGLAESRINTRDERIKGNLLFIVYLLFIFSRLANDGKIKRSAPEITPDDADENQRKKRKKRKKGKKRKRGKMWGKKGQKLKRKERWKN